jgi:hypothetical protein
MPTSPQRPNRAYGHPSAKQAKGQIGSASNRLAFALSRVPRTPAKLTPKEKFCL